MRVRLLCLLLVAVFAGGAVAFAAAHHHHVQPPPATATASGDPVLLGTTTVQATSDGGQGASEAFGYTATVTGTATSASVYLASTGGVSLGLYADNASKPGAELDHGSVTSNAKGWVTVALTGAAQMTAGARYWIAIYAGSSTKTIAYRDAGNSGSNLDYSGSGLSNPYKTTGQWSSNPASAYIGGTATTSTSSTSSTSTTTTSPTSTSSTTTTPTTSTTTTTTSSAPPPPPPPTGSDCFASPGSCGYPDPAASDVGPYGASTWAAGGDGVGTYCDAALIAAGACTTMYQPVACSALPQVGTQGSPVEVSLGAGGSASDETVNGYIEASGSSGTATVANVCVISPDGSGASGAEVGVDNGLSISISHSDIQSATGDGSSNVQAVRCWGGGTCSGSHNYYHLCGECLHDGNQNVSDSYVIADGQTGHREAVYASYQTYVYTHDVLLDPPGQEGASSDVFVSNSPAPPSGSTMSVTGSLLAGGNAIFGTIGPMTYTVTNNDVARCTPQTCTDSATSSGNAGGYYNDGGQGGVGCPGTTGGDVWSGNVWDDNSAAVGC